MTTKLTYNTKFRHTLPLKCADWGKVHDIGPRLASKGLPENRSEHTSVERTNFDPRELMERAVQVMGLSVADLRTDGKLSPSVGAVLWEPNGDVETAYRGELRDGDHAEYTLLDTHCWKGRSRRQGLMKPFCSSRWSRVRRARVSRRS